MLKQQDSNTETPFIIDFDAKRSDEPDPEFESWDSVFALDVEEFDGRLRVNALQQFDMGDTPKLKEVMNEDHPLHEMWCQGILAELIGLQANKIMAPLCLDTLTSEERKHLLPSQIILKLKRSSGADRAPIKAKARWVVDGHRAVQGYHHDVTAAKGCNASTIRLLAVIASSRRQLLFATDIEQAFTSAELDPKNPNRIIIRMPRELESLDSIGVPIVQLLLKNTYGLPNAGYMFALALDTHLAHIGFTHSTRDHNLHRRDRCLYASYIDDGTGTFPSVEHYEKFISDLQSKQTNGNHFKLGLAQVQEETLGCKVTQAMHQPAIGKPGETGYRAARHVDVGFGQNWTKLAQPGLTVDILQVAEFLPTPLISSGARSQFINSVRVPMLSDHAKILDEDIPKNQALAKSIRQLRAAKSKGHKSPHDIQDDTDPFSPQDDIDEYTFPLSDKEREDHILLQPIFGKHYRTIVGKLLYLTRLTRPDIATAVGILSRYVSNPGYHALAALKHLCRYLLGTRELGIIYPEPPGGEPLEVRYYSDSNYPMGRARLGMIAMIGYTDAHGKFHGRALDWHSRLASTTSNSTAEAELYAAYHAFSRALFLKKDTDFAGVTNSDTPCRCFEDNMSVFHQYNSPLIDSKLKWISNKYLRGLELVATGEITVEHVSSKSNYADMMTKGTLSYNEFMEFRVQTMGM